MKMKRKKRKYTKVKFCHPEKNFSKMVICKECGTVMMVSCVSITDKALWKDLEVV